MYILIQVVVLTVTKEFTLPKWVCCRNIRKSCVHLHWCYHCNHFQMTVISICLRFTISSVFNPVLLLKFTTFLHYKEKCFTMSWFIPNLSRLLLSELIKWPCFQHIPLELATKNQERRELNKRSNGIKNKLTYTDSIFPLHYSYFPFCSTPEGSN